MTPLQRTATATNIAWKLFHIFAIVLFWGAGVWLIAEHAGRIPAIVAALVLLSWQLDLGKKR